MGGRGQARNSDAGCGAKCDGQSNAETLGGMDGTRIVHMLSRICHVQTVLLMSQQKLEDTIHVGRDLKPEDATVAESKGTYAELQACMEEKYGFKVSNLYIAWAKEALGIKERENDKKPKAPSSKKRVCPSDKMAAIQEALRHFKMIECRQEKSTSQPDWRTPPQFTRRIRLYDVN